MSLGWQLRRRARLSCKPRNCAAVVVIDNVVWTRAASRTSRVQVTLALSTYLPEHAMMSLLRREVLIPVLVCCLAAAPTSRSRGRRAARARAPAVSSPGRAAQSAAGPVADVRLDLLTATGGDAATVTRNPFRFQQRAVPPAVRRAAPRPSSPPPVPTGRRHRHPSRCGSSDLIERRPAPDASRS
jgi:hypothetical protein